MVEEGAQLIDVRAGHEWDAGHIAGATHLPLDELAGRTGEIDPETAPAEAAEEAVSPWQRAALVEGVGAKGTVQRHLEGGFEWLS